MWGLNRDTQGRGDLSAEEPPVCGNSVLGRGTCRYKSRQWLWGTIAGMEQRVGRDRSRGRGLQGSP